MGLVLAIAAGSIVGSIVGVHIVAFLSWRSL